LNIKKQKGAESKKLELEAALKNSLEELETKKKEISLLQKQVIEFEQKLQQGGEKISLKVIILPKVPKHA
jgi:predicted  nucleic acid-binding Zn-ribbon protein